MCYILYLLFSNGDTDRDSKVSTSECEIVLNTFLALISFYWNEYDKVWISKSNKDKCEDMDANSDTYLHPNETIRIFQHFMDFSSEIPQDLEFQTRYTQVTCEQCEWYDIYNF